MSDVVLSERPAPHVRLVTLNRPDQLNAINSELCAALHEELRSIAADRSCRAVIVTGAGRGFCAGVDLRGYGQAPGNDGTDAARDHFANQEHMSRLILQVRATPQPVIAAVNGGAAGFGIALACASDIRYAARSAVFRAAFINIGLSNCDMATSWLLPRLIGASRAHELMLTGRRARTPRRPRASGWSPTSSTTSGCSSGRWRARSRSRPGRRGGRASRSRACGRRSRSRPSRPRSSTRTASRSWRCTAAAPGEAIAAYLEKRPAAFAD